MSEFCLPLDQNLITFLVAFCALIWTVFQEMKHKGHKTKSVELVELSERLNDLERQQNG